MERVKVFTNGASRGNPGPAATGVVVCDSTGRVLREQSEFLGRTTNNVAEYRAVIRGLRLAAALTRGEVELTTDSELIVRQLTGKYRVVAEPLRRLVAQVRDAETAFAKVVYRHAPRMTGLLARADRLANECLDEKGA